MLPSISIRSFLLITTIATLLSPLAAMAVPAANGAGMMGQTGGGASPAPGMMSGMGAGGFGSMSGGSMANQPPANCMYETQSCKVTSPDLNYVVSLVNGHIPASENDCLLLPACGHHSPPPPPNG